MFVYNKIKWILGVLMVFVLIITTNLIDKNNFIRVKNTVYNIYDDRLIAKDLIFKISNKINEKQIAIILNDIDFFTNKNVHLNKNIDSLMIRFEETELTKEESFIFNQLKDEINILKKLEGQNLNNNDKEKVDLIKKIEVIKKDLIELSKIQLIEGSRQLSISKKAFSTIELFTQIEIYILVFLAIIVQIIIVYNPKKRNKIIHK